MTVEQFKEKFEEFQKESNEVYSQIKPLLKRLKTLTKKAETLANKANDDDNLYVSTTVKDQNGVVSLFDSAKDNWDTSLIFRLTDFECLTTDEPMSGSVIECIDNVLYNIKHTKFYKAKGKKA